MGSRGDVQPGLVLARGLRERGHEVTLGVAPNLLDLAEREGLTAVPLGVDSAELLRSDLVRARMRSRDPRERVAAVREVSVHGWDELRTGLLELAEGADVVLTGLLGQEVGSAVAERVGCGFAALHYAPVRANDVVGLLPRNGGPRLTAATWRVGERLRWQLTRAGENRQRAALGLAPAVVGLPQRLAERGALEVQAYDPVLMPQLAERWGPRRPFVGYLRPGRTADVPANMPADLPADVPGDVMSSRAQGIAPDAGGVEDPELERALGEGAVHVGFGSMPVPDPAALLRVLDEVAERLGTPIVWGTGWSEIPAVSSGRLVVRRELDHAAVLPRCLASVHHGGAGTTGAVLAAGVPQVVCWFSADQPLWARLLHQAGVGEGMAFRSLDVGRLTDALRRVLADGVRERARTVADRVVPEVEALAAAIDALERAH
ncbi:glycosyltransferase [Nocardioides faecalis]|uniref:glycosyltransferase n=1 Tax=Nocardioides faecalis TaxID=2803858 RepID=UPI0027DC518A|nr:glycosyltransferase [Nocardioides faecalis]